MTTDAANDNDEPYCIGRVYYGPYPHNFTYEDLARAGLDNKRLALNREQWLKQNPDVSQEELAKLAEEIPF